MIQNINNQAMKAKDNQYCNILIEPLKKSANYLPKMGGDEEVDFSGFKILYGSDPLYHWLGLDSPLMFSAHKAAGGMTSIYRQLGIGCERLFRQILRDELDLSSEQVKWSYTVLPTGNSKKPRVLSLDGRIELLDIKDLTKRERVEAWIRDESHLLGITTDLKGAVFEVRQGYKSADSKRQNADLANAAQALGRGYLPVLTLMSTQMNQVVHARYQVGNWAILIGTVIEGQKLHSTFSFLNDVIGYDLISFFERNTDKLRSSTHAILTEILNAETTK